MRRAIEMAVAEGHLHQGTDAAQMAFEIHALILALHYEARFLGSPDSLQRALTAFDGIVGRFSTAATPAAPVTPSPARTRKTTRVATQG
jgi:hypothetical protein